MQRGHGEAGGEQVVGSMLRLPREVGRGGERRGAAGSMYAPEGKRREQRAGEKSATPRGGASAKVAMRATLLLWRSLHHCYILSTLHLVAACIIIITTYMCTFIISSSLSSSPVCRLHTSDTLPQASSTLVRVPARLSAWQTALRVVRGTQLGKRTSRGRSGLFQGNRSEPKIEPESSASGPDEMLVPRSRIFPLPQIRGASQRLPDPARVQFVRHPRSE